MILRRWLASVRTRLRGAAADQELDDELRTHLEMAVEENLARGMSEREATRAAAGASRVRLCRQLLTESVAVSALAGLLGLALAAWLAGLAAAAVPPEPGRRLLNPIDLDGRVASWAALAALLMGRSLWTLLDVDIGWTAENAVALEPRLSGARYERAGARSTFLTQLADLIAAAPGVERAAPVEEVPFLPAMLSFGQLDTDDASVPEAEVTINYVSNRYLAAAEIPIVQGRGFDADAAEPDSVLISRDLADRLWPEGTAVGQRLRMPGLSRLNDGNWLTVVGVAGSVHGTGFDLDRPDPYEIYLPWSTGGAGRRPRFDLVRTAGGADPIALLKEQVWRLDSQLPVTVHAMDDVVGAALAEPRFYTTLLAAFAVLAVLLAGAGLYAVVAYETSARTREIGVRVALGATRRTVIRHVLGRSMLQSAGGAALGLLGALALTRLLAPLLYDSAPTDPASFTAAAVFLLAAAVAGAWLPARRAARTDPMTALRAE